MKCLPTAAEIASTAIKNREDCEEKLRKAREADKKEAEKAAARAQEITLEDSIALRSAIMPPPSSAPPALGRSKRQRANTNY